MKKNGFTLVELLAVIVILAIIALIATPIILNIIGQAQEGADARSVEVYAKTIETNYYVEKMQGSATTITSIEVTTADYNGDAVTCTSRTANADGTNLTLTGCTVGGRNVTYSYANGKATKTA